MTSPLIDPDFWPDISPWPCSAPDVVEVDNPIVATLLGPDGTPLVQIRQRRTVPFGFAKAATR